MAVDGKYLKRQRMMECEIAIIFLTVVSMRESYFQILYDDAKLNRLHSVVLREGNAMIKRY